MFFPYFIPIFNPSRSPPVYEKNTLKLAGKIADICSEVVRGEDLPGYYLPNNRLITYNMDDILFS